MSWQNNLPSALKVNENTHFEWEYTFNTLWMLFVCYMGKYMNLTLSHIKPLFSSQPTSLDLFLWSVVLFIVFMGHLISNHTIEGALLPSLEISIIFFCARIHNLCTHITVWCIAHQQKYVTRACDFSVECRKWITCVHVQAQIRINFNYNLLW